MAFLAVFVALKIAHRAGGYAGLLCTPRICDLRYPEHHLVQLKKSVKRNFRGQIAGESDFLVRHDAVVFRPNRRHEQNRNGSKTPKTGVFWVLGPPTTKAEAKSTPGISARCAIAAGGAHQPGSCFLPPRGRGGDRRSKSRTPLDVAAWPGGIHPLQL